MSLVIEYHKFCNGSYCYLILQFYYKFQNLYTKRLNKLEYQILKLYVKRLQRALAAEDSCRRHRAHSRTAT